MVDEKIKTQMFNVSIHDLLRYGYGGMITLLMCWFINPSMTERIFGKLVPTTAVLVVILVGAFVYTLQRWTTGWAIDILSEFFHRQCKSCFGESKRNYLERKYKIKSQDSLNYFRIIREGIFNEKNQRIFHKQHSEISMLHVTSFICIVGGVIGYFSSDISDIGKSSCSVINPSCLIFLFGIFCLCVGVFADISVSAHECLHMKEKDSFINKLINKLESKK